MHAGEMEDPQLCKATQEATYKAIGADINRSKGDYNRALAMINGLPILTTEGKNDVMHVAGRELKKGILRAYLNHDPSKARQLEPFIVKSSIAVLIYQHIAHCLKIPENTIPEKYKHLCPEYQLTDFASPFGIGPEVGSEITLISGSWDRWTDAVKRITLHESKTGQKPHDEMRDLFFAEVNKRHEAIFKFYKIVHPDQVHPPKIHQLNHPEKVEENLESLSPKIFELRAMLLEA